MSRVSAKVLSTQIKSNISFQIDSQACAGHGQWKSTSPLLEVPSVCSWTQLCLGVDQTEEKLTLSLFRFFIWKKLLPIFNLKICLISFYQQYQSQAPGELIIKAAIQVIAQVGLLMSSSHGLVTGDTWRCRTDDGSNFLPPIRFCLTFFCSLNILDNSEINILLLIILFICINHRFKLF